MTALLIAFQFLFATPGDNPADTPPPAAAHEHKRDRYVDPLHDLDNCNKQQFPQCSGGEGGGQ